VTLVGAAASQVRVVSSFEELLSTPFADGVNALCWARELPGDFAEIARQLNLGEGITTLEESQLLRLELSAAGKTARDILLRDQELLRAADLAPSLDYISGDVRDVSDRPVPTDVYSWHVDSATVPADTWLCSYTGAASEGLRNDQAVLRVDVPATRAQLLAIFGGADGPDFREFLAENCYDLHYVPIEGAQPFSFGFGNLWRIATQHPGSPVPPCIHRAPAMRPGDPPRLLLIS
jgi:hypothetical protein